jgi:hypothetical protein
VSVAYKWGRCEVHSKHCSVSFNSYDEAHTLESIFTDEQRSLGYNKPNLPYILFSPFLSPFLFIFFFFLSTFPPSSVSLFILSFLPSFFSSLLLPSFRPLRVCLSSFIHFSFSLFPPLFVVFCLSFREDVASKFRAVYMLSVFLYRRLIIRAFAIRVFAYPRFYFSITRSINILSAARF